MFAYTWVYANIHHLWFPRENARFLLLSSEGWRHHGERMLRRPSRGPKAAMASASLAVARR
jgi:hypothetical protein